MNIITVSTSNKYDIFIERGLIKKCGEIAKRVSKAEKAVIVTDDIVGSLYLKTVKNSFEQAGFRTYSHTVKNGEQSKNLTNVNELYDVLSKNNVCRTDILIALGGGVIGDLAGFVAATYLRGIDFIQMPTTLLAQNDSSVGGKTGVNIESGKNLVGAFKQPICVICDIDVLNTLTKDVFADGVAEIIKHGIIKNKDLFFDLLDDDDISKNLDDVIYRSVNVKRDVVEKDEFDKGERMILNFGHTVGHAIEKYYNYEYSHGKAVAIGMSVITGLSEKYGLTQKGVTEILNKCLHKYNLPSYADIPVEKLIEYSLNDKKNLNKKINLILIKEIGKSIIFPLSMNDYKKFIAGEYKN